MFGPSSFIPFLLSACLFRQANSLSLKLPSRDIRTGTGTEQYLPSNPAAGTAFIQVDRAGWTVSASSFQPGCEPQNVLSGTGAKWWESQFAPTMVPLPHNIVIDMKNSHLINGFRMLPRQDGPSGDIGQHKIETSLDGRTWTQVGSGSYLNNQARKTTLFPSRLAQFVRLTALSTAEGVGYQYTTVAEINVLSPPKPTLPRENWQVKANSENPLPNQHRAAEAADGVVNTYWSTQFDGTKPGFPHTFTINQGSAKAVSGLTYLPPPVNLNVVTPGRIGQYRIEKSTDGNTWSPVVSGTWADTDGTKSAQFATITVQYLRLTALSEAGNRGTISAASEINLIDGSRQPTAFTVSVDSEDTTSTTEDGRAANALDGNPATSWITRSSPAYPHFFRIDMQASYAVRGLIYIPRQASGNQGNIGRHLIETSVDGNTWTPVSRGTFEDDQRTKVVNWRAVQARYLRLTAQTEAGNRVPFAAAAELQPIIQSSSMTPAPESMGQWGETITFPLVPVAAALIPSTSEVVVWSAWNADFFGDGNGKTVTANYNPSTGVVTQSIVTNTGHDMFCPGISFTKTGLMVVSGGTNSEKTSIYNPDTRAWTSGGNLVLPRGYNSQVTLSGGSIFNIGGSWSGARGGKDGELYDPATNTWTLLPGCPVAPLITNDIEGIFRSDNHAWLFARQNNSIFQAGPSRAMNWYTTSGNGGTQTPAGTRGTDTDAMNGNAVMYDAVAGKILTIGGSTNYVNAYTTSNAHIITLGAPNTTPLVTKIPNAHYARTLHNSVVLPDGKVFIVGGLNYAKLFVDDTAILYPELFDPTTNTFTVQAPMSVARTYHSIAILLSDATVLVGGGGLCGPDCTGNHYDAQIYKPPYLFNSDQSPATRPKILSVG
ncbi:MAG: hypothetical protein Q9174_003232, partial [Haloplaca sp. 1 TL-2023]